uniref:hypothetical protein n=1 Tax=Tessaracoccus coleopterorum TaxID=2714950 RepID=UPI0038CD7078
MRLHRGRAHRGGRPDPFRARHRPGVDGYGRLVVATPDGLETFAVGDVVHARLGR